MGDGDNFSNWRKKALALKGGFFILSGPSGVGKTSLVEKALTKCHHHLDKTITYTTRTSRDTTETGNTYHFVSRDKFQQLKEQGAFLEWAEVYNEFYATAFKEVCRVWQAGKTIIKDVDTQGGKNIKKLFPQSVSVFVYPPSIDALKKRLIKRGLSDSSVLEHRLRGAESELAEGIYYDYKIVNEDFKNAWLALKKIIEKHLNLN